jgi:hypothetical protein
MGIRPPVWRYKVTEIGTQNSLKSENRKPKNEKREAKHNTEDTKERRATEEELKTEN